MSMSTHVVGFKPPDATFKKMLAAYRACEEAGTEPPKSVIEYFGGDEPDEAGVEVGEDALNKCGALSEYEADDSEAAASGYELDISKLPKDIKIIRFINSW